MFEFKGHTLPSIAHICKNQDLAARKSLGQNFLIDDNISQKIVSAAEIDAGDTVLEIGPGLGSLSRHLLNTPATRIILLEKDQRFLPYLEILRDLDPKRVTILSQDALKTTLTSLKADNLKIISNLPYNIGTQLIINWLQECDRIGSLTLMLQKEVVDRLTATPNTAAYGRLTILVNWLMDATALFKVPATAFSPAPKVTSRIVRLVPRPVPLFPAVQENLEKITHTAFQQRRKMLRTSLKSLFPNTEGFLEMIGIPPTARPETLTTEQFCFLANHLQDPRHTRA